MTLKDFLRDWRGNDHHRFCAELWNAAVEACAERAVDYANRLCTALEAGDEKRALALPGIADDLRALKASAEEARK